jgi:hypothetical protein
MPDSDQLATLKRALEIAGDIFQLSVSLRTGAGSLFAMLRGDAEIDDSVFLRAVGYINEGQAKLYHVKAVDYHQGPNTLQ